MKPTVSVVIPIYNRALDLKRALESVRAQTMPRWEALVVDNHSDDNIDEIVAGFNDSRIKLFKVHNDGVIAVSRNVGIKHAEGEFVAFLDSDDWWMPRKLEESLAYLERGADVVYHSLYLVTKSTQRFHWKKVRCRDLQCPIFDDLLKNGNALSNSSVVVRKTALQGVNGLSEDPSLVAAEDYDMWLRIADITEKFRRIPKTLGFYWAGGGNMSNPMRELRYLDALEKRYSKKLIAFGIEGGSCWMKYARGLASYRAGDYATARTYLEAIRLPEAPLSAFVRSRLTLHWIGLQYHGS